MEQDMLNELNFDTVTHEIYYVRRDKEENLYDLVTLLSKQIGLLSVEKSLHFKIPRKPENVIHKARHFTDVLYPWARQSARIGTKQEAVGTHLIECMGVGARYDGIIVEMVLPHPVFPCNHRNDVGLPMDVFATSATAYAREMLLITPPPRVYFTRWTNLCFIIGQLIASGVLRWFSLAITRGFRIPFALQVKIGSGFFDRSGS